MNKLNLKFILVGLCGAFVVAISTQAFASDKIEFDVEGKIGVSCGLVPTTPTSLYLGDVSKSPTNSHTISYQLDCNAPFQYTLGSANGGMKVVNPPQTLAGSGTFKEIVPYRVNAIFATDLGSAAINDNLSSQNIIGCDAGTCSSGLFSNSGAGVASAGYPASLTIDWDDNNGMPLQSGDYQDTLVLTVSVR